MEGRDASGKFTKGWRGGPGRPKRATERDYLVALTSAVPLADWEMIVAGVVEQARAGDLRAVGWLSRYLLGAPGGTAPSLGDLARAEAADTQAEDGKGAPFDFGAAQTILDGLRRMPVPPPVPAPHRPSVAADLEAAVERHAAELHSQDE